MSEKLEMLRDQLKVKESIVMIIESEPRRDWTANDYVCYERLKAEIDAIDAAISKEEGL